MNFGETALTFPCAGETLVGIVAVPERANNTGVVLAVGGPQYRAGSHRQFTLLARRLAAAGFPTLRFDYRGMGDSTGALSTFEDATPDIDAALNAFYRQLPGLGGVVLWGLCDAASAALLHAHTTRDTRVRGLCLLNPWVRSEETLARTQVKHYYTQRLLDPAFWHKVRRGELAVAASFGEFVAKLVRAFAGRRQQGTATAARFQDRMAAAWRDFPGEILLILSGNDHTAKEFLENATASPAWRGLLERPKVSRVDLDAADHTFSSALWRQEVEAACLEWLDRLAPVEPTAAPTGDPVRPDDRRR